jgi:hypothetical protein
MDVMKHIIFKTSQVSRLNHPLTIRVDGGHKIYQPHITPDNKDMKTACMTYNLNELIMIRYLDHHRENKYFWVAAVGVFIGMVAAAFILPGGDDLYRYYQPFEKGCLACGYVPFHTQWFLWPLLLVNYPFTWPLWTMICLTVFFVLFHYTKVNPLLFLISFPMLGQVWLGQIDVIVCTGLVLLLFSRKPFLQGLGITLALVKPQISILAILFMLVFERRNDLWKILLVPVLTMAASLFVFGFAWPFTWLQNAFTGLPIHVWRLASNMSWRFGLILLPVPLLFNDRRKRLQVSLLVSAIATPFFGVYSYIVFLLFDTKWWMVILSFAWFSAYPFLQANAMQYAWILPLTVLFNITLKELREHRQLPNQRKEGSYA